MLRNSARSALVAILSLLTIGAALSASAAGAEEITEDQMLRALTPAKKPLTRSLSMGAPAQADPAAEAADPVTLQLAIKHEPDRNVDGAHHRQQPPPSGDRI